MKHARELRWSIIFGLIAVCILVYYFLSLKFGFYSTFNDWLASLLAGPVILVYRYVQSNIAIYALIVIYYLFLGYIFSWAFAPLKKLRFKIALVSVILLIHIQCAIWLARAMAELGEVIDAAIPAIGIAILEKMTGQ